jgi:hypothetical protein
MQMLRLLSDLPSDVLGIEAIGEVSTQDYESVLVPAIEERISRRRKLRLLYVFGRDFTGFSAGAAWEDAKVGMRHFTSFDRIAVVTNIEWIAKMVRAFGFVMPAEVRVFAAAQLRAARAWIIEARAEGNLEFELLEDSDVLVLRPHGELEAADFERVAAKVDPYIDKLGGLAGLVVIAEEFPGWEDFAAFTSHFRFVREHHAKIRRVALVTSSRFLAALPRLARHFVAAEVRKFDSDESTAAIAWAGAAAED